jgi:hypothetical protein
VAATGALWISTASAEYRALIQRRRAARRFELLLGANRPQSGAYGFIRTQGWRLPFLDVPYLDAANRKQAVKGDLRSGKFPPAAPARPDTSCGGRESCLRLMPVRWRAAT